MLPDKNKLNDELIERISGGKDCQEKNGQKEETTLFKGAVFHYICPTCGMLYLAAKQRTDGFCPECRPEPLKTEIPSGDMKATILGVSNKDGLVKIH